MDDELVEQLLVLAGMVMEDAVPVMVRTAAERSGARIDLLHRTASELGALATVVGVAARYQLHQGSDAA